MITKSHVTLTLMAWYKTEATCYFNIMTADVLAPCVARTPAAMISLITGYTAQKAIGTLVTALLWTEIMALAYKINSLWPDNGVNLMEVMTCCLFGTKPLPEVILPYLQLDTQQWFDTKIFCQKCSWRQPFCWGLSNVFNPLWPSDAIWWHRSGSTLTQVLLGNKPLPEPMLTYCQ